MHLSLQLSPKILFSIAEKVLLKILVKIWRDVF